MKHGILMDLRIIHAKDVRRFTMIYPFEHGETTSCHYCIGIESHGIVAVKTVIDEYLRVIPAYDTPYNYCPNCGRKIKED